MTDIGKPTFSQRDGAERVPDQLKPKELSQQLRAMLFGVFLPDFEKERHGTDNIWNHWNVMMRDYHVEVLHQMPDTYAQSALTHRNRLGAVFKSGPYNRVFDLVEWLLARPHCPRHFAKEVARAFVVSRSAYRLVDNDTVIALTDGEEAKAFSTALTATKTDAFVGVRAHLKNAGEELRNGRFPESVRENIHAVEAIVQVLEPEAVSFAAGLSKLENRFKLHGALKAGFAALYGFTSDAKGIRHSLGGMAEADADEALAIYMIGTCSSFVNFLITKSSGK